MMNQPISVCVCVTLSTQCENKTQRHPKSPRFHSFIVITPSCWRGSESLIYLPGYNVVININVLICLMKSVSQSKPVPSELYFLYFIS